MRHAHHVQHLVCGGTAVIAAGGLQVELLVAEDAPDTTWADFPPGIPLQIFLCIGKVVLILNKPATGKKPVISMFYLGISAFQLL